MNFRRIRKPTSRDPYGEDVPLLGETSTFDNEKVSLLRKTKTFEDEKIQLLRNTSTFDDEKVRLPRKTLVSDGGKSSLRKTSISNGEKIPLLRKTWTSQLSNTSQVSHHTPHSSTDLAADQAVQADQSLSLSSKSQSKRRGLRDLTLALIHSNDYTRPKRSFFFWPAVQDRARAWANLGHLIACIVDGTKGIDKIVHQCIQEKWEECYPKVDSWETSVERIDKYIVNLSLETVLLCVRKARNDHREIIADGQREIIADDHREIIAHNRNKIRTVLKEALQRFHEKLCEDPASPQQPDQHIKSGYMFSCWCLNNCIVSPDEVCRPIIAEHMRYIKSGLQ